MMVMANMPKQERAIRTRATLIEASAVRIAADGYVATTYAKIVSDAGLAVGTMLFHFQTKQDIGRTLVYEAEQRMVVTTEHDVPGVAGVEYSLVQLAELVASSAIVRAGLRLSAESVAALELQPGRPQLLLLEHVTQLLLGAHQRGEIPAAVDVYAVSEALVEVFFGACTLSLTLSAGADLPSRIERALPVLLARIPAPAA